MATITAAILDSLNVSGRQTAVAGRTAVVTDHLTVSNTLAPVRRFPIVLRSALRLRAITAGASTYGVTLRSTLRMSVRRISAGVSARLGSTLRLHPSTRVAQATRLRSTLELAVHTTLVAHYRLALRDVARLSAIGPAYAQLAYLHSRLALHSSLTRGYHAAAQLFSSLDLSSMLHPQLAIVIVYQDVLELDETQILRAIYDGTLGDTVQFLLDVVDPGGDVTAWAMNARTGAVTEYMNYGFAAFAQSASGPYLGADGDGLYELAGADDAGEPVIADLIGGLTDFGGSFLSGFKAAYLAVRGDGQFFLKLTSGTGRQTVYGVNATSLKTTRINMGKGHRSRFFSFELVSTGQDFDLVGLNFLPIQQTRRI